ncbi:MAG: archaemetzincin [Planctomycetota bacterium]
MIDRVLRPAVPKDALCYIAFTGSDLWPGEGWNFVFGLAGLRERVGVWSLYRFGDPARDADAYRLCLQRTIKVGVHETGHMISMEHCIAYECIMNGSNHLQEMDSRPLWLCPVCLRKTCFAVKADPVARYRALEPLARDYGLTAEADFFARSITILAPSPPPAPAP